jgi:hypothetical protein
MSDTADKRTHECGPGKARCAIVDDYTRDPNNERFVHCPRHASVGELERELKAVSGAFNDLSTAQVALEQRITGLVAALEEVPCAGGDDCRYYSGITGSELCVRCAALTAHAEEGT